MDPSDLLVEFDRSATHLTIAVRGELDAEILEPMTAAIAAQIRPREERVALELGGITFCGSAGLTLLLRLDRLVRARGGALTLEQPSPAVLRVLEATKLTRTFSICDDRAPAQPPHAATA
jgi:stage II sporulation protein AA (anti-sigma F factor antagonist)